jgi:hypothetical protein
MPHDDLGYHRRRDATPGSDECPAEWWALMLVLGVYSPLSIAAMPPVSLVDLSWAMDPSDR